MNLSGESSNSKRHQRSLSITESEMLERLDLTSNVDEVMENDTEKIVLDKLETELSGYANENDDVDNPDVEDAEIVADLKKMLKHRMIEHKDKSNNNENKKEAPIKRRPSHLLSLHNRIESKTVNTTAQSDEDPEEVELNTITEDIIKNGSPTSIAVNDNEANSDDNDDTAEQHLDQQDILLPENNAEQHTNTDFVEEFDTNESQMISNDDVNKSNVYLSRKGIKNRTGNFDSDEYGEESDLNTERELFLMAHDNSVPDKERDVGKHVRHLKKRASNNRKISFLNTIRHKINDTDNDFNITTRKLQNMKSSRPKRVFLKQRDAFVEKVTSNLLSFLDHLSSKRRRDVDTESIENDDNVKDFDANSTDVIEKDESDEFLSAVENNETESSDIDEDSDDDFERPHTSSSDQVDSDQESDENINDSDYTDEFTSPTDNDSDQNMKTGNKFQLREKRQLSNRQNVNSDYDDSTTDADIKHIIATQRNVNNTSRPLIDRFIKDDSNVHENSRSDYNIRQIAQDKGEKMKWNNRNVGMKSSRRVREAFATGSGLTSEQWSSPSDLEMDESDGDDAEENEDNDSNDDDDDINDYGDQEYDGVEDIERDNAIR